VPKDRNVLRLRRSISEHLADPRHAGSLDGADRIGNAGDAGGPSVAIGVWFDRMGRVQQARWTVTAPGSDALGAYAEVACTLLEGGVAPATVDANALRRTLDGVTVPDQAQADLVARAISAGLCPGGSPF
jgi:hypothetical protein